MSATDTAPALTKKQEAALARIEKAQERATKANEGIVTAVQKARDADLTWRHIAETMGVSVSTVYNRYNDSGE